MKDQPSMKEEMKKGMWKSTIQEVYQHPTDKEAGMPPLFRFQVEVTDLDFERVKGVPEFKVNYELSN